MTERYQAIHAAVKAHYLGKGRTEEQWQAVAWNPAKFNRVWRHALRLPASDKPPPHFYRQFDPTTGEAL